MKKHTLLALYALAIISCSEDNSNNNASLDGTLKLTYVNLNRPAKDLNGDGTASENYLDESDCLENSTIIFGSGDTAAFSPNCMSVIPDTPEVAEFVVSGDQIVFTYYSQGEPGGYKEARYTRSGNTLTATFEEPEGGTYPFIPGDGENGDTNSYFRDATFVYSKQ